jgi:ATP-binding cassette subfamily B protein
LSLRTLLQARLAATRQLLGYTRRTLALVVSSSPALALTMALLTFVGALTPLAIAYAGKRIIDAVVASNTGLTARWVLVELVSVVVLAITMRGLGLSRAVLGARLGTDVNVQILEKAQALELSFFENSEFYDKLTRARREASARPVALVADSFQIVQNVMTLVGYAALLTRFSAWLVLGLLAATVPATLAEMRHSKLAFRLRNWRSPDSRRLLYLEYVLANDEHVKEVKLFGLGPHFLQRYRSLAESFYEQDKRLAVRRAIVTQSLSLIGTAAFYGAYALMALQAARGRLTLGDLTLYVVSLRQGQQAFQSVLSGIGNLYEHNLYMSNLFEYLAMPERAKPALQAGSAKAAEPRPAGLLLPRAPVLRAAAALDAAPAVAPSPEPATAAATDWAPPAERSGLRFENVGFCYPGKDKFALRGLSLHIGPAESLAIVGQNGAGKTTLVKLLVRLYEPTEGRILLDGVDLQDWPAESLRRRIGVLFQDFNQYQLSVRENVGAGSIEHLADESRILRALSRGGADSVAAGLTGGLDAPLGTWFAKGSELSGGQWQKIALSRAFMREEADILVLDEPTAALDAESEHAVFERFRQLSEGRTTIVISHRFPTVRMAQRIIVLEHGQVIEQGSHEELLGLGGKYAHMFALQAAGYQ